MKDSWINNLENAYYGWKPKFSSYYLQGVSRPFVKNLRAGRGYLNKHISYKNVQAEMQRWGRRGCCWVRQINMLWWLESSFSTWISSNMCYYTNAKLAYMHFTYGVAKGNEVPAQRMYMDSFGVVGEWIVLYFRARYRHWNILQISCSGRSSITHSRG